MCNVKITEEAVDELLICALSDDLKNLKADAKKIKKTKKGFVFSLDYKEDIQEMNKLIESYKQVLAYYGVRAK